MLRQKKQKKDSKTKIMLRYIPHARRILVCCVLLVLVLYPVVIVALVTAGSATIGIERVMELPTTAVMSVVFVLLVLAASHLFTRLTARDMIMANEICNGRRCAHCLYPLGNSAMHKPRRCPECGDEVFPPASTGSGA